LVESLGFRKFFDAAMVVAYPDVDIHDALAFHGKREEFRFFL
jgi:hypothetical protein